MGRAVNFTLEFTLIGFLLVFFCEPDSKTISKICKLSENLTGQKYALTKNSILFSVWTRNYNINNWCNGTDKRLKVSLETSSTIELLWFPLSRSDGFIQGVLDASRHVWNVKEILEKHSEISIAHVSKGFGWNRI